MFCICFKAELMKIFFLLSSLSISVLSFSQQGDFIVLKKNQHTIKTLFAGSAVSFKTTTGTITGKINGIERDSLFVVQYDVRRVFTSLGVYMIDTIASIQTAFHYKDVTAINKQTSGFNWGASGANLMGGGVLITTVGLGTWIFTKPGTQYHAPIQLVAGSAILAGVGYLLMTQNRQMINLKKIYVGVY